MSVKRKRLSWVPTWDQYELDVIRMARKNLWRVSPHLDEADLYQELAWMFLRVKDRYPGVAREGFKRLFLRASANLIHTLAHRIKERAVPVRDWSEEVGMPTSPLSSPEEQADLAILLSLAPEEVHLVYHHGCDDLRVRRRARRWVKSYLRLA